MEIPNTTLPSGVKPFWLTLVLGRNPKLTFLRLIVLVVTSLVVFKVVLAPIRVTGISMEPTYRDGQINFVNRMAYLSKPPARGDVVAIKAAEQLSVLYLKRVIGLPGETVSIRKGVVFVDGAPIQEPYLKGQKPWRIEPTKLQSDEYVVVGDNRSMDQENHTFGKVRRSDIVGRILW